MVRSFGKSHRSVLVFLEEPKPRIKDEAASIYHDADLPAMWINGLFDRERFDGEVVTSVLDALESSPFQLVEVFPEGLVINGPEHTVLDVIRVGNPNKRVYTFYIFLSIILR